MAAHADDGVPGSVQTDVALERGPVPFALAAPAAAAAARAVPVVAALSGGEASSAGPPAVTRGAGIRGGHVFARTCNGSHTPRRAKPTHTGPDPS